MVTETEISFRSDAVHVSPAFQVGVFPASGGPLGRDLFRVEQDPLIKPLVGMLRQMYWNNPRAFAIFFDIREIRALDEALKQAVSGVTDLRAENDRLQRDVESLSAKIDELKRGQLDAELKRQKLEPFEATATPSSRRLLAVVCSHAYVQLADVADEAKADPDMMHSMCRLFNAGLVRFEIDRIVATDAGRARLDSFLGKELAV